MQGGTALIDACQFYGVTDVNQIAYVLATAWHETAKTMQPIAEFGRGRKRKYGQRIKLSGKPYTDTVNIFYGRGFVQLTWYENYYNAGKTFSVDLINSPDLVMTDILLSAKIAVNGMVKGAFTGKKLSDYFTATKCDFIHARRIINGMDKADLIAGYADQFRAALL